MANLKRRVEGVRGFNRFYTRQIGVLRKGFLGSPFSLTEARVLYELAHRERPAAAELRRDLELDAGYLSRILHGFARRGLVVGTPSNADGRQTLLSLTRHGRRAFAAVDARQHNEVAAMLRRLSVPERERLVEAMRTIEDLLATARPPSGALSTPPRRTAGTTGRGRRPRPGAR